MHGILSAPAWCTVALLIDADRPAVKLEQAALPAVVGGTLCDEGNCDAWESTGG